MSAAAVALRDFMQPLLPDWRFQFGRWSDEAKDARFCVIRPAGGVLAELVREPQFTVSLIGALDDAANVPSDAADTVIDAMRTTDTSSGAVVFLQPGEPAFFPTSDGRPISEFAVSAITT